MSIVLNLLFSACTSGNTNQESEETSTTTDSQHINPTACQPNQAEVYFDEDRDQSPRQSDSFCMDLDQGQIPAGYCSIDDSIVGFDCDDQNDTVGPNRDEICDGLDNDCDGVVDNGVTTLLYQDNDFDGYGDPNSPIQACDVGGLGIVANSDDCNDSNSNSFPGNAEICDGVDNDCDTLIDTDDVVEIYNQWYRDTDGDGYGEESDVIESCEAPAGYVEQDGDCDETTALRNPGNYERRYDGIDNDCEELTADDDVDGDGYPLAQDCDDTDSNFVINTFYRDQDSDGYGLSSDSIQDCTAPAGYVSTMGDANDSDSSVYPNATEICDEKDNNQDGVIDEGVTIPYYQDQDGDGYGLTSLVVNTCSQPVGYSTTDGDADDSRNTIYPSATEICDNFDNDQDGAIDEGVTTTYYLDSDHDNYGTSAVTIQSCSLPSGYASVSGDADDSRHTIYPGATEVCDNYDNDQDGSTDEGVTTTYYRDSDGDGFGNLSVTRSSCSLPVGYATNSTDCNDASSLVNPNQSESSATWDDDNCNGTIQQGLEYGYDDEITTSTSNYYYGNTVSGGCDITGDGIDDAVVSAVGNGSNGVNGDIFIYRGGSSSLLLDSTLQYTFSGNDANSRTGESLSICGDYNNDGQADLVIGAMYYGGSNEGYAYMKAGPISSNFTTTTVTASFSGSASNGYLAEEMTSGDVTNDSYDDLILMAPGQRNGTHYGTAYIFAGSSALSGVNATTSARTTIMSDKSPNISSMSYHKMSATVLDFNGDGVSDLSLGDSLGSTDASNVINTGQIYLFEGPIASGTLTSSLNSDYIISGDADDDRFGWSQASGDFDADGYDDIAVGAKNYSNGDGALYIINNADIGSGSGSGLANTLFEGYNDRLGENILARDINSDGVMDVGVSLLNRQGYAWIEGSQIQAGNYSGLASDSSGLSFLLMLGDSTHTVESIDTLDIDNDGLLDMIVGNPVYDNSYTNSGNARVFLGSNW